MAEPGIHAVIDRIEDGGVAVIYLGDGEDYEIDMSTSFLPEGAAEGDHLRIQIALDPESRAQAEERNRELKKQLDERAAPSGQKEFKL